MKKTLSDDAMALLQGADFLEKQRWWSGEDSRYIEGQVYCAVTAVNAVYGEISDDRLVIDLIKFNDYPGRTKEEVVAYMRLRASML